MKTQALAALCLTASIAATSAAAAEKPLRVVLIDVEGGAATLFVTPEGRSLLVDTGWPAGLGGPPPVAGAPPAPPGRSSADVIVAAANKAGVRKIDYLMISHYHLDHIGGAVELLGKIPVGTVLDHGENREQPPADRPPSPNQTDKQYARYIEAIAGKPRRSVKAGETFKIGSLSLDFVSADRQVITKPLAGGGAATAGCEAVGEKSNIGGEENPRSVGFVATYGKARILNLADLTWDVEKQLVCAINQIGKIDLMVVSHHGSDLSNTPTLMAATAPTVALVANGARKGGDKPVLERLKVAPSQPAVWQVHYATRAAEANTAERQIANLVEGPQDQTFSLQAEVDKTGAITIVNERNSARETYPKR
jgi:beta-lactamase superfamily II metal-dependent hydrolase